MRSEPQEVARRLTLPCGACCVQVIRQFVKIVLTQVWSYAPAFWFSALTGGAPRRVHKHDRLWHEPDHLRCLQLGRDQGKGGHNARAAVSVSD